MTTVCQMEITRVDKSRHPFGGGALPNTNTFSPLYISIHRGHGHIKVTQIDLIYDMPMKANYVGGKCVKMYQNNLNKE